MKRQKNKNGVKFNTTKLHHAFLHNGKEMDRLVELKAVRREDEEKSSKAEEEKKQTFNIENDQFFADIDSIRDAIAAIAAATARIKIFNANFLQAVTIADETEASQDLDSTIKDTNKQAYIGKVIIQRLRDDLNACAHRMGPTDYRLRNNMLNSVTKKFMDEMRSYQDSQSKAKSDIKKKTLRQIQLVKPDATMTDVDTILRAGGSSGELVQTAILTGNTSQAVQQAFLEASAKYLEVINLEASIAELHQMFLDLAVITEKQGELLDNVEIQVQQAGDYVEEANRDLVQSIETMKSIRKKQVIIALIVILVVAAIVLITLGLTIWRNPPPQPPPPPSS